jgi:hypothetical protein
MNPIARKDGRISSQLHCEKSPLEAVYKVNWDAVVDKQNKRIGVSEHYCERSQKECDCR